jgi:hypothetical protein
MPLKRRTVFWETTPPPVGGTPPREGNFFIGWDSSLTERMTEFSAIFFARYFSILTSQFSILN